MKRKEARDEAVKKEAELAAQDKAKLEARSKAVTAVGDRTRPVTNQPHHKADIMINDHISEKIG